MTELKPCPFCGGEAKIASVPHGDRKLWYVICRKCEIATFQYLTEKWAVKVWNRRVNDGN